MELWDLYDRDRQLLGRTMARGEKQPEGTCHLVVHICLFNSRGEMLIQQRQSFKSGWSNFWDLTVGGSAVAGESSRTAAEREVREELGLSLSLKGVRPALTVHFDQGFDDVYVLEREVDPAGLTLQSEEVQAVRWASLPEILEMVRAGAFIPYHESLLELLCFLRNHGGAHTAPDPTRT
mgnify:FL=1